MINFTICLFICSYRNEDSVAFCLGANKKLLFRIKIVGTFIRPLSYRRIRVLCGRWPLNGVVVIWSRE